MRDYLALLTSQHRDRPRFRATVELLTSSVSAIRQAAADLPSMFDLDTAVGVQLDAVGLWVGISRIQRIPTGANFFAFDVVGRGWDEGVWKGAYGESDTVISLDDSTYRSLIKAKIGGNYWGGTLEDVNRIGETAFEDLGVRVSFTDNLDMTVSVNIEGNPPAVLLELLQQGVTPPKTLGVRVVEYVFADLPGSPVTPVVAGAPAPVSFGTYKPVNG